jgi:alpha-glucosidase
MVMATEAGMRKFAPERRPFVLTRSGFAGMQRYAATWTGDNVSSWDHLRLADLQCQRLATSGVSFAGSDVGGFMETPSAELFCRWMQLGAFHVFFRNHCSGESESQEPWCFGTKVLSYVRTAIENRYRLLPYFYTQFYRYSNEGYPIIRSLPIQFGEFKDTHWRGAEFFVGDDMYVVPILEEGCKEVRFYVPPGTWYDYESDAPLVSNLDNNEAKLECSLEHIPVFVRGGAVIPHWSVQQYVGELEQPPLYLHLWWAKNDQRTSYLYLDSGDGYGYKQGEYRLDRFDYESNDEGFVLRREASGQEELFHSPTSLILHGYPKDGSVVKLDGQPIAVRHEGTLLVIDLPLDFRKLSVSPLNKG